MFKTYHTSKSNFRLPYTILCINNLIFSFPINTFFIINYNYFLSPSLNFCEKLILHLFVQLGSLSQFSLIWLILIRGGSVRWGFRPPPRYQPPSTAVEEIKMRKKMRQRVGVWRSETADREGGHRDQKTNENLQSSSPATALTRLAPT